MYLYRLYIFSLYYVIIYIRNTNKSAIVYTINIIKHVLYNSTLYKYFLSENVNFNI